MEQKWPKTLWLVRHGQSAGNVARDAAEAASLPLIDIVTRDVDTPLSALGEQQARALGRCSAIFRRRSTPTSSCARRIYALGEPRCLCSRQPGGPRTSSCSWPTDQIAKMPLEAARGAAHRWNTVVALKGATTFIASPAASVP